MAEPSDQQETIAFLSRPASYGPGVRSVEWRKTHGSIVFLAAGRAYKLKRAVRYPYMDYSTPALRHLMCDRELETNRRLAPQLYLGIQPIVREDGRLRLGDSSETGAAVDWVVVMRRFDESKLLERMRRTGNLSQPLMHHVAEAIATFHRDAERTPKYGGANAIRTVIDENLAVLTSMMGEPFPAEAVARYEEAARPAWQRLTPLLEARRKAGKVRRCHGDLHLNNICLFEEHPLLFDAIEFNDDFSCIDVLYDVAFLLMDLDTNELRGLADEVLNRYLELTGEHGGLAAMPLFLSCRAAIRAHTRAAAVSAGAEPRDPGYREAAALLDHAVAYLAPAAPRLIALGGVSGTGKSTLARALAPFIGQPPGAVVIRSDIVRKELMGVSETTRLPESAYTPAVTETVYRRIRERASAVLDSGYSAIADAVHGNETERSGIAAVASSRSIRFDGVWLEAPTNMLRDRVSARADDASDATAPVLEIQLRTTTRPQSWTHVQCAGDPDSVLAELKARLA